LGDPNLNKDNAKAVCSIWNQKKTWMPLFFASQSAPAAPRQLNITAVNEAAKTMLKCQKNQANMPETSWLLEKN